MNIEAISGATPTARQTTREERIRSRELSILAFNAELKLAR